MSRVVTTYRGECDCKLAEHVVTDSDEQVLVVTRLAVGTTGPNKNPRARSEEGFTLPLSDMVAAFQPGCTHNRIYLLGPTDVPDPTRRRVVIVASIA